MSLPNSSDPADPFVRPLLPPPPPPPLDFDPPPTAEEEEPTLARPRLRRPAEVLPDTSFVDRYRGTEWQPEPEATPPAEPGQRRAPPAWLLMLGGVALTLVGLAALVSFVMGSVPTTPLGGFKQMTPEPTRSHAPPASPPAPTTAVLPAPPTQAPWLIDPLHPAGLFKAAMTAAGAAYRLDLTVTMDTGGQQAKMVQTADVSGAEYSLTELVTTVTQSVEIAAVRKGLYYYTKMGDQPWVRRAAPPAYGVLGNLDSFAWAGMQYVGPESVGDRLMHHLRVPINGWPGAADTMVLEVVTGPPTYTMDVWVDDKGRPSSARVVAQLTLRVGGHDAIANMDATYSFSRWGKRPRIAAPDRFNPG